MKEAFIENWEISSEIVAGAIGFSIPILAGFGLIGIAFWFAIYLGTDKSANGL